MPSSVFGLLPKRLLFFHYPLDNPIILCYNIDCQEEVQSSFLCFIYEINYATDNNSNYCSFINFRRHKKIKYDNLNKCVKDYFLVST